MLDGIVVVVFPSHPPPHLRDVATVAAAMSLRLLVLWLVVVLLVLGLLLLLLSVPGPGRRLGKHTVGVVFLQSGPSVRRRRTGWDPGRWRCRRLCPGMVRRR